MMNNNDIINQKIPSEEFEFVQKGKKIYDQKIQTKSISYLQDVWLRFRKNRMNVIASSILLFLIVCSILMPVISGKEYVKLNEKITFLPPRVPIIEKLGILDGTIAQSNKPVDLSSYDEKSGLYLPEGYDKDVILMNTLKNSKVTSTEKSPYVQHGQSVLRLDFDSKSVTVQSKEFFNINKSANPYLVIDVYEKSAQDCKLNILLQTKMGGEYKVIDTITTTGKHTINLQKILSEVNTNIVSQIRLQYTSDVNNSQIAISSISLFDDTSDSFIQEDEGYNLSLYKIVDGKGIYVRQNGEMIVASFRYNKYKEAFGITHEPAFSSDKYKALLKEWKGKVKKVKNPDNPNGWYFTEGFPIREVVKKNDSVVVDGKSYSSYDVYIDYAKYMGYKDNKLPYYLFGTTQSGRDVFSLVWVGLRTSLLIGIIVTLINVSIGVVYGAISGYYGGMVDLLMQRFAEIMGRIPWLVVLSIVIVLVGPGISALILTMIISGWIGTASTTRMQFYRYKGREYVLASKTMGAKDRRLIFKHILPNGIGTIITVSILSIPGAIFTEASLSFLGFGIGHGQSFNIFGFEFSGVSIGVLLSDAREFMSTYPHLLVFPAVIVSILMITFNMFGNALRDAFNPSLRGVED